MKSLGLVVALLAAAPALAQVSVPQQLAYEGRLAAKDGTPSTGTHSIKFAFWPSPTGGASPLWTDTLSVTFVNGLYSVVLGTTTDDPLPPTLFDGTVRYLELTIDQTDTLTPRQAIGSVPYSIVASAVLGGPVNATSYAFNGTPIVNDGGHQIITYNSTSFGPVSTSLGGIYCGSTSGSFTGKVTYPSSNFGGYLGTKLICQDACVSPTAHMCSGAELVRSMELTVPVPTTGLWYSTGGWSLDSSYQVTDCRGWTAQDASAGGQIWGGGSPGGSNCSNSYPLACCD